MWVHAGITRVGAERERESERESERERERERETSDGAERETERERENMLRPSIKPHPKSPGLLMCSSSLMLYGRPYVSGKIRGYTPGRYPCPRFRAKRKQVPRFRAKRQPLGRL